MFKIFLLQTMSKHSEIILEDRNIFGFNKVHKNVLRSTKKNFQATKARVVHSSVTIDEEDVEVNNELLDFVIDGFKFNTDVVTSKAKHALPYNPNEIKKILDNKNNLGNQIFLIKRNKSVVLNKYHNNNTYRSKSVKKKDDHTSQEILSIQSGSLDSEYALVKFKPKVYFTNKSLSTENLISHNISTNELNLTKPNSKSCEDLVDNVEVESFFLTESQAKTKIKNSEKDILINSLQDKNALNLKDINKSLVKWDDYLIDQLSENTARWIAVKSTSDSKQKKKLVEFVEEKYGKYTHRDVKDLDLYEFNLTDYEKKKIEEEKHRLRLEKEQKTIDLFIEEVPKEIPIYRMQSNQKRDAIYEMQLPDPAFKKKADTLKFASTKIRNPISYEKKMLAKNLTSKTLLTCKSEYEKDMTSSGGCLKHEYTHNSDKKIELLNDKTYIKNLQPVFPAEFTAWISGIELLPEETPQTIRPVKGKKRWSDYPTLIDDAKIFNPNEKIQSYWSLLPTISDTQLKKAVKQNLTVAKIVDEWRKKWQTASRWTIAEIDELITDMNDESPNIRFQGVVICTRAVESIQVMVDKLKQYDKKFPIDKDSADFKQTFLDDVNETDFKKTKKNNIEELIFSAHLFSAIEKLLEDPNQKVKLCAGIAIFIILRSFQRPMKENTQNLKDRAESVIRENLSVRSRSDQYTAAQCLALDGFCEPSIIDILLKCYFRSTELFTKQQVTKTLSDLSGHQSIILDMIANYLTSPHERERLLACKLIPCVRRALTKEVTNCLVQLMWYDVSKSVKKVASQTLGRTGRGREVHAEILKRLQGFDPFEKIEALRKINTIGIMTDKMLGAYLKCFRDEHTTIRELACRSSQCIFQQYEQLVESLEFMLKYDPVAKLKAMAIRALSLIGERSPEIRKSLLWSLQFEIDPLIRTEACHCIIILFKNPKDDELINILQERYLLESEPIVRQEIMAALDQLGYNSDRELPILAKIRGDVTKFGDKTMILQKIKDLEAELTLKEDMQRLLWNQSDQIELEKRKRIREEKVLSEELIEAVSIENLNGNLSRNSNENESHYSILTKISEKKHSNISFNLHIEEKATDKSFLEKLVMN